MDCHLSDLRIAPKLQQSTRRRKARNHNLLLDLAPDEVYPAFSVTGKAVGSYPAISPLPAELAAGGIFSATLSVIPLRGMPGHYPASFSMEPGLSSTGL